MSASGWCEEAAVLVASGAQPAKVLADVPASMPAEFRDAVRAVARLTQELGSPVREGLAALSSAIQRSERVQDSHRAALAAPMLATRMLLFLPVGSALLGVLFGFDTVGFLFGNVLGWLCLLAGVGLTWLAMRWSRTLLERASNVELLPGFTLVLIGLALSSGAPSSRAVAVATSIRPCTPPEERALHHALANARTSGAPLSRVLDAHHLALVREVERDANLVAAKLPVRLTVPLAVGILPAFIVLGVLPLLASALASTTNTLITT